MAEQSSSAPTPSPSMPGMRYVRIKRAIFGNTPRGHLPGDVLWVNDDIARRYIEAGIAEPVADTEAPPPHE